jgi:hypothetical protein
VQRHGLCDHLPYGYEIPILIWPYSHDCQIVCFPQATPALRRARARDLRRKVSRPSSVCTAGNE